MPSYLDIAEIQKEIEEEDLIPNRADIRETAYNHGEFSSDSDSDHRDIAFDSTHFNGDSSSEEEKLLGKGLKFTDLVDSNVAISTSAIGGMLSNLATMSSSLLTAAITSTVQPLHEKENNSSDSEFEIISSDDVRE